MMQVELNLPQIYGMSHQFPFWEHMLSEVALPLPIIKVSFLFITPFQSWVSHIDSNT